MSMPPRPTLRCLKEDLVDDWGDVRHQRAIFDLSTCPPLHSLDHPLVRHALATFTEGDVDAQRESISGLVDPMWYKLKSGRWRGAVLVDDSGQAWLCAAGRRYGGESKDFYKAFTADIAASGATRFRPSDDDRRRLCRERAEAQLSLWERRLHDATVAALGMASDQGSGTVEMVDFAQTGGVIAVVYVEVFRVEEGGESLGDVAVTVTTRDWSAARLVGHGETIVLAAICPDEELWMPGHTHDANIYSVSGSVDDIKSLVAAATAPGRVPGATRPGSTSHYTHKERLAENYVEGTAAQALCGVVFVPRRSPDGLEACAGCEAVLRVLA